MLREAPRETEGDLPGQADSEAREGQHFHQLHGNGRGAGGALYGNPSRQFGRLDASSLKSQDAEQISGTMVDGHMRGRIPCKKHVDLLLMPCLLKYVQEEGNS